MQARDPHRYVNELDAAAVARLIARLEGRAKDAVFARLFDNYAGRLDVPAGGRVLEVGCGTGAMTRALARRADFRGVALGVDHSAAFVAAANEFAAREGIADRASFRVGDAQRLDFPDGGFDAVFAHTVLSHVAEPSAMLGEMARVTRRGGTVAIFDGDYQSMTYGHPDHEFGRRMDTALVNASFNNPRIMRELARRLPAHGLRLKSAWGDAVVEIGQASYFRSFAETYAPYIVRSGACPQSEVDAWLASQHEAMRDGTFFASCTYYTYLATRA